MSQTANRTVPHKLVIKNKEPGTISKGGNTQVELDGKPLKLVSYLKFEVKPAKVAKVVIEMYCDVEIEADVDLQPVEQDDQKPVKIGDHIYTLGKYMTDGVAVPVVPKPKEET